MQKTARSIFLVAGGRLFTYNSTCREAQISMCQGAVLLTHTPLSTIQNFQQSCASHHPCVQKVLETPPV